MANIKEVMKGRADFYMVDPRDLFVIPGWNNREAETPENKAHFAQTKASIAEVGVKEPLTVFWQDGKLAVEDGHVRLGAVMELIGEGKEIESVRVKMSEKYSNDADRLFGQIVRNAGKQFTPYEKAKVFKRLIDFGWTEVAIAAKSGMTKAQVVQLLELLSAPEPVQAMVKAGEIAATTAVKAVRAAKGDGKKATETLNAAKATAKAAGRERVRPRDVKGSGKTFKTEIREIFSRSQAVPGGIMFADADFARIKELLKIGDGK